MHTGGHAEPTPFPERVGRYELLLPIASGGMGTVYLARTTGLGGFEKEVALKLTHSHLRDESGFATALVDEANLAGRIRHPNVVSVLDVGEDPHGVFLVMEYVEGETLAGLARLADDAQVRIPESVTLRIVVDVLAGLHAAHELRDASGDLMGLVHRDVTPHNVLVGVDGISKLTDFGVAKAATRLAMTGTGLIKGKVAYMAPEQALGHPLDRTCDIWAVGVVVWELLAGTRLHPTTNDAATLLRIVSQPPPRLRLVRPDVPPRLDDVVARALEPDRSRRYATAEELGRALEAAALATVGRADQRQVGQYVRQAVAQRLDRRRAKIAEVLALRGRLSRITRAALPSSLETPSAQPAATLVDEAPTVLDRHAMPSDPAASGPGGTLVMTSDPRAAARVEVVPEATGTHTQTETISVSTARAGAAPVRRRRVGAVLAVGGTVVALGVAAIAVREDPTVQAASSATSEGGTAAPSARAMTPDDLPLARVDEERTIVLAAAAPITAVRVGDREVEFTRALREQRLAVTLEESGKTLSITVADGRTGTVQLGAAERFDVVLGPATHAQAPASPRRAPSPVAPSPAKGGLLGNPYGGSP